jgi:hypothetical protein
MSIWILPCHRAQQAEASVKTIKVVAVRGIGVVLSADVPAVGVQLIVATAGANKKHYPNTRQL